MALALIDSYSETNYSSSGVVGDSRLDKRVGQTFSNTNSIVLDSCKLYLSKNGTPTGNIYIYIYAHTGTYGSTGKPTGSILATSDIVNVSSVTAGSFALYNFNFSGANRITLSANTKYCLALRFETTSLSPNQLYYGYDATSPTHSGNYFYSSDGINFTYSSEDIPFYIYGEGEAVSANSNNFFQLLT